MKCEHCGGTGEADAPLKIEAGKEYWSRTLEKRVRIYATDGGRSYPIHGAALHDDGAWTSETWDVNLVLLGYNSVDLVPLPPPTAVRYVPVCRNDDGGLWAGSMYMEPARGLLGGVSEKYLVRWHKITIPLTEEEPDGAD